jgi:hypothetical protein
MNDLDAIRAAFRLAVQSDDLFVACALMERAVGLGPFLPRQFPEMASRLAIHWELFLRTRGPRGKPAVLARR